MLLLLEKMQHQNSNVGHINKLFVQYYTNILDYRYNFLFVTLHNLNFLVAYSPGQHMVCFIILWLKRRKDFKLLKQ